MNSEVASVFKKIADILEIQGANPFRVRSYQSAARVVQELSEPLRSMVEQGKDLTEIPGIGKGLAGKIHEILETGTCQKLEELRKDFPPHLTDLLKVRGLGAKKVKLLHDQLGLASLEALKQAAEAGQIRKLPGMGPQSEQNILKALATLQAEAGRIGIKQAADRVLEIGRHLDRLKSVKRWVPAGSFRRRRETVGDLDILVVATDRHQASQEILSYQDIERVIGQGEEKVSLLLRGGVGLDFRFFEPSSFGAALLYFTGSKAHNITMRKRALKFGYKLNEYGLFKGERQVAGGSEEEVFQKLKLDWIPPELREDHGELEAAEKHELPRLLNLSEIQGELHVHTQDSDGQNSLEEMVAAARQRNYRYLAITDHSQAVSVAQGLDERRLRIQLDRIRKLDELLKGFWLLSGVEVDILKDGKLDLAEKLLSQLDWVVASVHSHFNLDQKKMTERILRAVNSGVVHCLGHPLARLIGKRDPIRFDLDRVFEACREQGVCLEINAHPERLDLPDAYCRRAKQLGLKLVITTDAHHTSQLGLMELGVWVARRGWLEKGEVLNTLPPSRLRKHLKRT